MLLPELQQKLSLQVHACHWPLPTVGADEVSGEVVVVKSLSYILLLMVPEQVQDWHFCSYQCVSFLVLWLTEEVLTFCFFFFAFWGKSLSCVHQLCFLTVGACCSFLSTMCECNHKVVYFLNNFFCSGVVG